MTATRRRPCPRCRRGCGGPSGRCPRAAARHSPRSTFDRSMPALAHTKPCLVSLMMRSPRRRRMRTDSASTSGLWLSGSSGSMAHQPALGLRHDLLGDDDDVAVGSAVSSPRRLGDEAGQVVAGRGSRRCRRCRRPRAGSSTRRPRRGTTRASAAARRGSRMIVGGDDAAHALGLDRAGQVGVGLVDRRAWPPAARRAGRRRRPMARGRARRACGRPDP